jgi:hypothetical protein
VYRLLHARVERIAVTVENHPVFLPVRRHNEPPLDNTKRFLNYTTIPRRIVCQPLLEYRLTIASRKLYNVRNPFVSPAAKEALMTTTRIINPCQRRRP